MCIVLTIHIFQRLQNLMIFRAVLKIFAVNNKLQFDYTCLLVLVVSICFVYGPQICRLSLLAQISKRFLMSVYGIYRISEVPKIFQVIVQESVGLNQILILVSNFETKRPYILTYMVDNFWKSLFLCFSDIVDVEQNLKSEAPVNLDNVKCQEEEWNELMKRKKSLRLGKKCKYCSLFGWWFLIFAFTPFCGRVEIRSGCIKILHVEYFKYFEFQMLFFLL